MCIRDSLRLTGMREMKAPDLQSRRKSAMFNYKNPLSSLIMDFVAHSSDPTIDNLKRWWVLQGHTPAGSAVQCFEHFGQMLRTKDYVLRKFDYGFVKNVMKYGMIQPPAYNLASIREKVHLIVGQVDRLSLSLIHI
eukprot:TRINITY_DN21568_c0_g1_i1.p1 TRINITY_DN21568_c0_g1~~TRINITY_DN21568_c0_g1_i1.p1  ORF type:complete len:155 (-),score=38.57 TRINITY_DN21568_c0_g1_i1:60-467(-)